MLGKHGNWDFSSLLVTEKSLLVIQLFLLVTEQPLLVI